MDLVPECAPAPCVLVLGGGGFIGRHVVEALLGRGINPEIGSRDPARLQRCLPAAARGCPARRVRFEHLLTPHAWRETVAGIDVVLNCVGILRERGRETYDRVHHQAPAALAGACRDAGIRLVHVSALGLDGPCRSGFLRSKQQAEVALVASGASGCIVRPSLLDAPSGGYGAAWIRRVARWPLLALPADAVGRIAALDVRDLGEALTMLALKEPVAGMVEYEFGGQHAEPLRDYIARLRRGLGRRPARVVAVPGWLARAGAHACDVLNLTPFSFGHWELLRRDNCPSVNHLPAVLGRAPRLLGNPETAPPPMQATPQIA